MQRCTTLSSCDAEIVALCLAGQQALWIRNFLGELGFPTKDPTQMFEDKLSAIKVVTGSRGTTGSKHIGVRYNWLSENINDGSLSIEYCPTEHMTADIFLKHRFDLNMQDVNLTTFQANLCHLEGVCWS